MLRLTPTGETFVVAVRRIIEDFERLAEWTKASATSTGVIDTAITLLCDKPTSSERTTSKIALKLFCFWAAHRHPAGQVRELQANFAIVSSGRRDRRLQWLTIGKFTEAQRKTCTARVSKRPRTSPGGY